MKSLLNILNQQYPLEIAQSELEKLGFDKKILEESGLFILSAIRHEISCGTCGKSHPVQKDAAGNYYIVCTNEFNGGFEKVDEEEITIWRFEIEKFLRLLASKIGCNEDIVLIIPGILWSLGRIRVDSTAFSLVYLRGNSLPSMDGDLSHTIVLTNSDSKKVSEKAISIIKLSSFLDFEPQEFSVLKENLFSQLSEFARSMRTKQKQKTITYKNLEIDISKQSLTYGKYTPVTISTGHKAMEFLLLMMQNPETLVQYLEIARILNTPALRADSTNDSIAKAVTDIKKVLRRYLKKVGLDRNAISELIKMIQVVNRVGYKLQA